MIHFPPPLLSRKSGKVKLEIIFRGIFNVYDFTRHLVGDGGPSLLVQNHVLIRIVLSIAESDVSSSAMPNTGLIVLSFKDGPHTNSRLADLRMFNFDAAKKIHIPTRRCIRQSPLKSSGGFGFHIQVHTLDCVASAWRNNSDCS
jgi:hypothetical protein